MRSLISKLMCAVLVMVCITQALGMNPGDRRTLLSAVTTTGAGAAADDVDKALRTYQAYGQTTAGSGAATIKVQGSNDNTNWVDLGTITLTLTTTTVSDGFASNAPWKYVRGNVTALSGTGAAVTLMVGV
jgi:hypothetical protein